METTTIIAWLLSNVGDCDVGEWVSTPSECSLTNPFVDDNPC